MSISTIADRTCSDVKKGLQADLSFNLGQPFRPYQQLMGVLPDRSKKIVPSCYHELMTSPESPIIDFYPRDFELDMNGKKMEWEAVVKIPFIEENRLLTAMATKEHLLTDDERMRNEFGVSLKFTYSEELDFTYQSSLPGTFPDLPHCHCVENIYDLPTMEGLDVHVGLMEGAKLGVSALAGFPSLHTIPHSGALSFHSVNVFQQDSRNESMVVTVLDADARSGVQYAKQQLGQRCFVGYPFLSEAKIVRVSDELFDYLPGPTEGAPPMSVPHGPAEIESWKRNATRIQNTYSKRLGMVIGEIDSLVHVEALKGLKKTDSGATVKEYAVIPGIDTDYATQMIVDEVESEDQRFIEKAALPIEEEFPVGTRAFSLAEYGYGRPLQVTRHFQNRADVWISLQKGQEVEFATPIIRDAERLAPYAPSYAVAKMLNLNPLVLSKLTASFHVDLYGTRVNLGLNLKFEAKKLKVLGYSRRGPTGWEFSEKAINLVRQYMMKFPVFVATVQRMPKGDVYAAADFYPENEALANIKEIQAWLKSIESKSFEKVPLDAEQLDSEVVKRLEEAADQAFQLNSATDGKKIKGMPRNALLKPSDAEHRLNSQTFVIGNRVVYVQDSGKVPIASKGTVVGLTRTARVTLLDVVFDTTFMSGTSLNDRCSPFRGSTVPSSSVLNLSNRQLQVVSRAGQARIPPQTAQPLIANGLGAPIGPSGRGQLIPATAPPPLRGSFRGAVNGAPNAHAGNFRGRGMAVGNIPNGHVQNMPIRNGPVNGTRARGSQPNGHLGRGGRGNAQGTNRLGYSNVQYAAVHANDVTQVSDEFTVADNPNFRPKPQHNVPPPASLDAAARGRGRGGRGRGGNGSRGRGPRGGTRGTRGTRGQSDAAEPTTGTTAVQQ